MRQPKDMPEIFSDILKQAHPNRQPKLIELDMFNIGMLVVALSKCQAHRSTLGQDLLPDYITVQGKSFAPDESQLRGSIHFEPCNRYYLSQSNLSPGNKPVIYDIQTAFIIGMLVVNGEITIDQEALALILNNESFFSEMNASDVQQIKGLVDLIPVSVTHTKSECLDLIQKHTLNAIKNKFYKLYRVLSEDTVPENHAVYLALKELIQEIIKERPRISGDTADYLIEKLETLRSPLTTTLDFQRFQQSMQHYDVLPVAASEKLGQAILEREEQANLKKAEFEAKREAFKQEVLDIAQWRESLSPNHSDDIHGALVYNCMTNYMYGLKTEQELRHETTMFQIGSIILGMTHYQTSLASQNPSSTVLPYMRIHNQASIAPNHAQICEQLNYVEMNKHAAQRGWREYHFDPDEKSTVLALYLGKQVLNGTIELDRDVLCQMIETHWVTQCETGKLTQIIQSFVISDQYLCSDIFNTMVQGGYHTIEEKFENALAFCKTPEKTAFSNAIQDLMQVVLKANKGTPPHKLESRDACNLAEAVLHLAQGNCTADAVTHFRTNIEEKRFEFKKNATVIFYIDLLIQTAIGLSVGLVAGLIIGATCGAIGTGALVGSAVGLLGGAASTRFTMWHAKEYQLNKTLSDGIEKVDAHIPALRSM